MAPPARFRPVCARRPQKLRLLDDAASGRLPCILSPYSGDGVEAEEESEATDAEDDADDNAAETVCTPRRRPNVARRATGGLTTGAEKKDGGQRPSNITSAPKGWEKLLKWSTAALGLDWGAYRSLRGALLERLCRRMADLGITELEQYRCLLQGESGEDELRALHHSVLQIDISRFFRTGSLWQFLLADVLPALRLRCAAEEKPCRCWIMGAGLGEEVYSLRACWEFGLGASSADLVTPPLEIVVSEIAEAGVAFAKAGEYEVHGPLRKCRQKNWQAWDSGGAETFREVPEPWLSSMLVTQACGSVRVAKRLRKGVKWRCESWDAPLSNPDWLEEVGGCFHLILGRHGPFFYPGQAAQREILGFCEQALVGNGYLVVGRDESRRFAKSIAPVAPSLAAVQRPDCLCDSGHLPKQYFGSKVPPKAGPAGVALRRAGRTSTCTMAGGICETCAPRVGKPGKMVWQKL